MTSVAIDTLRYARRLKKAGIDSAQAEAMSDALASELAQNLVTTPDLDTAVTGLRADLDTAVTGLKADLDTAVAGLKTDLATLETTLKAEMAALETRLTWRMLTVVSGIVGVAVALIKLV